MPLSHIRVLDFCRARTGPTCVRQLSEFGAQVINLTNSPSFALGSGSGAYGSTSAATGFPGYVQPSSPQFLDETIFSGSLGQLPYQRVIQFEARIDF